MTSYGHSRGSSSENSVTAAATCVTFAVIPRAEQVQDRGGGLCTTELHGQRDDAEEGGIAEMTAVIRRCPQESKSHLHRMGGGG